MAPTFTAFGFIEFRSHQRDVGKKMMGRFCMVCQCGEFVCVCGYIKGVKE